MIVEIAIGLSCGSVGLFIGWIVAIIQQDTTKASLRHEAEEAKRDMRRAFAALELEQVGFRRNQKTLDKLVCKIHPVRAVPTERNVAPEPAPPSSRLGTSGR
jgi:hypothetical protein